MSHLHGSLGPVSLTRLLAGACVAAFAVSAHATEYELIYTGSFNDQDALNLASAGAPSFFTGTTPFTIVSFFDSASPDLAPPAAAAPPFAGYKAYAPTSTSITIAGMTYSIEGAGADPFAGVTVSIFDQNSFTPGRYGIGLIANAPGDGAGIIGDFSGASPAFTVDALTATTFTGYNGVGYGSGVCTQGSGESCTAHMITPWVLTGPSGAVYDLTLGNYEEEVADGTLNTAQILAVPEPATYGMLIAGLLGMGAVARRRAPRSGPSAD